MPVSLEYSHFHVPVSRAVQSFATTYHPLLSSHFLQQYNYLKYSIFSTHSCGTCGTVFTDIYLCLLNELTV